MVHGIAGIHTLEPAEHLADRAAHALGGAPADSEVVLDVLKRQSSMRCLEPHGEAHDVLHPFVWHLGEFFDHPLRYSRMIAGARRRRNRGPWEPVALGPYGRKPMGRGRSGFASHSARSMRERHRPPDIPSSRPPPRFPAPARMADGGRFRLPNATRFSRSATQSAMPYRFMV